MSSVLSEYPEGLPAPSTGEVRPTERRKISGVGQIKNFRTVQRDRHGTRSYTFTFMPEQAAIFREWWVEWQQRGGGWFAASWVLPWGRGPHVFRFVDTPKWALIGGTITGQGYWRVSGQVEIRGRGMLPTVDVMYLTSTPYPIVSIEALGFTGGNVKQTPVIQGLREGLDFGGVVVSATAWNGFAKITPKPEATQFSGVVVSAIADGNGFAKITPKPEATQFSGVVASATAREVLITYSNYKPEATQFSGVVVSATATG